MDQKSIGAALAAQSLSIFLKLAVGTVVGLQSPHTGRQYMYLHIFLHTGDSTPFHCKCARQLCDPEL